MIISSNGRVSLRFLFITALITAVAVTAYVDKQTFNETKRLTGGASYFFLLLLGSQFLLVAIIFLLARYISNNMAATTRIKAVDEKEKSEIQFRNTFDKMLEGIEIIGFDWRYLYVNNAYEKQVRHNKDELLGYTIMEKFPGIEHTNIFKSIQRCFNERIAIHLEDMFTFPDGTSTWFEISFQPVHEGVFILSVDITEKKQSVLKIKQSEERFRALIENSYDIVSIIDENFGPVYRSQSSVRITGYTNEERDAMNGAEITHPDDLEHVGKTMMEVRKNPMIPFPLRLRLKHKDGHYLLFEGIVTNMLHNESIKGIVSNFRDITESQKAEEKIRQSEKIYKTIASSIPGSIISLLDKDHRYMLIEGDLLEPMGYKKENLLGRKAADVLAPARYKEVLPHLSRVFNGESFLVENYREGFDMLSRFVPLKDEQGNVFAAMVFIFDVSELKRAQRAVVSLNVDLEQKIKERTRELEVVNKELEAFSYSVAHDLRAPIRSILGYASILKEDYDTILDSAGKQLIHKVEVGAQRMGILIDDLLTFSRLGRKEVQKLLTDMNKVTQASLNAINLEKEFNGKIIISKLQPVMADSSLITYAMMNLLSNAFKYSSKNKNPVIKISSELKDKEIIYAIADNGVGFDMKYAHKLFGVFQRLHSVQEFEGTGIGLATVQRIIQKHNGKVWANAEVGRGATFYFSLPIEL